MLENKTSRSDLNKGLILAATFALLALVLGLTAYFGVDSQNLQGMIKKSEQTIQEFDKQSK